MMTFGSLFAGIGGFDLELERAGMKCVWQVENDPYAIRVLEKHWPKIKRHDDIHTFTDGTRGGWECPDVICGGPPCQRTSNAAAIQGKKTGETLWPEMFRIATAFKPRFVVVEQPVGNKAWEQQVKVDLESFGWRVSRLQFEACTLGAPHRRRRVFFIAYPVQERREALAWERKPFKVRQLAWPAPPRGAWRQAGADNRGVDDGFSDWVDRLECLGNAVVPQVAEWIGRRIIEVDKNR